MKETLEETMRRLLAARAGGDTDNLADALARHANALVEHGQTAVARDELDEAASIHRACGRVYDEARCTQFTATLCRFLGKLDEAKQRVLHALELAGSAGTIAVSAHAELGEIALAGGDPAKAADAYGAALAAGEPTGLIGPARAALLRKRAVALAATGRFDDAVHDLEFAHDFLLKANDAAGTVRTLIEQSTVLQRANRFAEAARATEQARQQAAQNGDHAALADVHLLLAAQALQRRDATSARAAAQAAREEALAATSPASYIGAVVTIARLAEEAGNRLEAYGTLASGWATLADLLGPDLARTTFAPKLKEMRERWGDSAFAEVRAKYEEARRSTAGKPIGP